ncbi:MAG TPA: hypothetical protein VGQ76_11105 [Thermoanaerobaculia bacterium]|jgi:hypothetical protein|nr:hypothetical protein [Thermoanaerobaculia bacterium]
MVEGIRTLAEPPLRVIERMLTATSTLMILCFGAAWLALQSRVGG